MYQKINEMLRALAFLAIVIATSARGAEEEKVEIPKPENMTFVTKDGVQLRCTWYGGTLGKKSIPIIMLHGWEGVRGNYADLATKLQARGHAVMVPDLRGHGESTLVMVGGELKEIDVKRHGKSIVGVGFENDIKTIKSFLLQKNNEGELNIEMLCVVAADVSCIAAMNWAVHDWNIPQFANDVKQGKDVKALVLLSPEQSFLGERTSTAEGNWLFSGSINGKPSPFVMSVMIIAGERDRKRLGQANKMYETLGRMRKPLDASLPDSEILLQKDLYLILRDVELQGTALLDANVKPNVENQIYGFIHYRLEKQSDLYGWTNRSRDRSTED